MYIKNIHIILMFSSKKETNFDNLFCIVVFQEFSAFLHFSRKYSQHFGLKHVNVFGLRHFKIIEGFVIFLAHLPMKQKLFMIRYKNYLLVILVYFSICYIKWTRFCYLLIGISKKVFFHMHKKHSLKYQAHTIYSYLIVLKITISFVTETNI